MEPRLYTRARANRWQRHCVDFSAAWRRHVLYRESSSYSLWWNSRATVHKCDV